MHCAQRLYRIIECGSDFLLLASGIRACLDWSVLRTQSRRQEAFVPERSSISSHRSSLDSLEKVVVDFLPFSSLLLSFLSLGRKIFRLYSLFRTFVRNSASFASVNCSSSAASLINFSVNALSEMPPALTRTL